MTNRNWQKHKFRIKVWEKSDKKCFYCKIEMVFKGRQNGKFMTVEHLTPKSHGGKLTLDNCVAACLKCNRARGNKNLFEWVAEQDELRKKKN